MSGDRAQATTVLVVEDDALVRMAAVDLIEAAGFATVEAENADQAISILEASSAIRLVFTDIDIPARWMEWRFST